MNEEKFTGKADLYEKFRPSYPNALIDFLYENANCETVADIGAGTGKFTQCLLKKPWKIIAVEPNSDMREKLSEIEGISIVNAPAENTGLADHSVGLVTAAQAFHWFDEDRFKSECKRILTDGGRLAVIWNNFIEEDLAARQMELCRKFCLGLVLGHTKKRPEWDCDRFLRSGYFSELDHAEFTGERIFDHESFIGETLSRSYAPKKGEPNYDRLIEELSKAFTEFENDGKAAVKCKTSCYLGKF